MAGNASLICPGLWLWLLSISNETHGYLEMQCLLASILLFSIPTALLLRTILPLWLPNPSPGRGMR